ncbi:MAG: hypothetical protein HYV07_02330 [Deltaproteobacteria bacterium]|nr:hypothetical protein [Deltaproteobacteria bacterium]
MKISFSHRLSIALWVLDTASEAGLRERHERTLARPPGGVNRPWAAMKIAYDVMLYFSFGRLRPPEEVEGKAQ